jgi:DNA-binding NtrC family response regulator
MNDPRFSSDATTVTLSPAHAAVRSPEPSYLLILEGGSSVTFRLPRSGDVIIGRAQDADVRLQDSSISRRHAQLSVRPDGQLTLKDLGSHNGTRVNGEPASPERPLASGDTLAIGDVVVVLYRSATERPYRPVVDAAALRQRLEEETERALRYQRPVAVLHIDGGSEPIEKARAEAAIERELRRLDVCAWLGAAQLAVVLPDREEHELRESAGRLLAALAIAAPGARAGYGMCPSDGCDADTLLLLARRAAGSAAKGELAAFREVTARRRFGELEALIADPAMLRIYDLIEQLAPSTIPVLVLGETGSGKEIAAAALHHLSPRRGGRLLAINCAALPEPLVESELFGHERGAFSGATAAKAGLLECAQGGTVFLDEVGELSAGAQAKLLRVLETRRLTRVGDVRERPVDFRLVAATNRDLKDGVEAGRFRQDLYFRLSAAVVRLPPLRHRRVELPMLARAFLEEARARLGRPPLSLSDRVVVRLFSYEWPGNLRELKNDMEFLAATVQEGTVEPWNLPPKLEGPAEEASASLAPSPKPGGARPFRPLEEELRELERARMVEALLATGGVQTRAADLIAMPRRTFFAKMKHYGLSPRGAGNPGP